MIFQGEKKACERFRCEDAVFRRGAFPRTGLRAHRADAVQRAVLSDAYLRLTTNMLSRSIRIILIVLGALFAYGLLLIVLLGGFEFLTRGSLPKWNWWQMVVAPFFVACLAIFAEVVFWPVQKYVIEPDRVTDLVWKRGLKVLALIFLIFGLLFVSVIMNEK